MRAVRRRPPAEDAQRPQRDPAARVPLPLAPVVPGRALVVVLESPETALVRLAAQQLDRVGEAWITPIDGAEVLQPAQHVVVPAHGIRQHRHARIGDGPRGPAAIQPALEQVLLAGGERLGDRGVGAAGAPPGGQALHHADGRVERGDAGTVLGPAVPRPVDEATIDEGGRDAGAVLAEVGGRGERHPVDAGLHLAVEVALAGVLPAHVLADARDRLPNLRSGRVDAEVGQLLEDEVRGRPGVEERTALVDPAGAVGAAVPAAVRILRSEELGTPALAGDARTLGRHLLVGRVRQVTQGLPAEGGVGVEQPVDGGHGRHGTQPADIRAECRETAPHSPHSARMSAGERRRGRAIAGRSRRRGPSTRRPRTPCTCRPRSA